VPPLLVSVPLEQDAINGNRIAMLKTTARIFAVFIVFPLFLFSLLFKTPRRRKRFIDFSTIVLFSYIFLLSFRVEALIGLT